ncbi:MAG TPA: inner-membrane translocator [Candidatus Contendobacter sp.]|nr:inner-membrane translocator [Candidatus Contendobacter sp.]HRD50717.1 inner-membrane translocator [Candidatus Contendobacter sp.]
MANTTPSNENAQSFMQGEVVQTLLKFLKANGTLVALVILMLIFSFWDESFFTPRNLTNLARQTTIVGIIAVGMTLVIIINGIDLSVGSIVGLAAIVVTLLMQSGVNIWAAILITLFLTGFLIGIWNGFWIAHYNIPPFIITLGMMTIARGIALTLSGGGSVPVTDPTFAEIGGGFFSVTVSTIVVLIILGFLFFSQYRDLKQKRLYGVEIKRQDLITAVTVTLLAGGITLYAFTYRGLPYPVAIFAVIVFFGTFMLQNTKFGRRIYAMGGNEEAARLSGINIYRMKLGIYCIITTLSALAGILLASRLNGASPNLGNMFELDAISAVIIGGTSFSGGVGTIVGTVIGAFIISVLNNGMSLLEVPTFYQLIIKGLIIILAVWFDVLSKKKRG